MEEMLVYSLRAKTRRCDVYCLTSAGRVYIRRFKFFATLFISNDDCESAPSIDFGVTSKF